MKTILVIDDDISIRENVAEILSIAGYNILQAGDGISGLKLAQEYTAIDLVLCDVMLPKLDGYGTLKIFNNNARLSRIPFVFLTGKSQKEDFRQGMSLGAADYITKPFTSVELIVAVQQRLLKTAPLDTIDVSLDGLIGHWKSISTPIFYYRDDSIIKSGQVIRGIHYLESGFLKMLSTSSIGKVFIMDIICPSDIIGDLFLGGMTQYFNCDVVCISECVVYKIDFSLLRESFIEHPHSLPFLLNRLSTYHRDRLLYFGEMIYLSSTGKLAFILLYLCDIFATKEICLPKQDLASLTGLSPETVSRCLAILKANKFITSSNNSVIVLEMLTRDLLSSL